VKLVPTYRLIYLIGFIFLPLTLLLVVFSSIAAPTIVLALVIIIAVAMDAYRSQGRLEGIHVTLPEVVRISKGREGDFSLQIENENLKVRRMRLGLVFPEEINTPAVEMRVELPEDNHGFKTGTLPFKYLLSGDSIIMGILVDPNRGSDQYGNSCVSQPV
jgi:hypothetical protein